MSVPGRFTPFSNSPPGLSFTSQPGHRYDPLDTGLSGTHGANSFDTQDPPRTNLAVEDLSLSELMKNPHVLELWQSVMDLTHSQKRLSNEVDELRKLLNAARSGPVQRYSIVRYSLTTWSSHFCSGSCLISAVLPVQSLPVTLSPRSPTRAILRRLTPPTRHYSPVQPRAPSAQGVLTHLRSVGQNATSPTTPRTRSRMRTSLGQGCKKPFATLTRFSRSATTNGRVYGLSQSSALRF